tara:strand:- start:186 stop:341 length:156 start_codon:yes stop_codon:yes gene_type:complete
MINVELKEEQAILLADTLKDLLNKKGVLNEQAEVIEDDTLVQIYLRVVEAM